MQPRTLDREASDRTAVGNRVLARGVQAARGSRGNAWAVLDCFGMAGPVASPNRSSLIKNNRRLIAGTYQATNTIACACDCGNNYTKGRAPAQVRAFVLERGNFGKVGR